MKLILIVFALITTPVKYDVETTAEKMYWDYKKDPSAADKKYRDKHVFLHGKVQARSANLWHVYLQIPDPEGLCATIDDDQLTKVPAYNPGDRFDLVCTGAGLVFNLPLVLHCRINN